MSSGLVRVDSGVAAGLVGGGNHEGTSIQYSVAGIRTCNTLIVAMAPAARADVLIRDPGTRICLTRSIKVGVWYQSYSGGPRTFRIKILDPRGNTVFRKSGRATTTWRYWRYRPTRLGVYKVVYSGKGWRAPYNVRVRACS